MKNSMLRRLSKSRNLLFLSLALGIGAMSYAYYLQFFEYLAPCPLCIFDRVFLLGILITLTIAIIHNPKRTGQRYYSVITFFFTLAGLTSAGRHVWLQHLPSDQVPACGPGLNYLLDTFPLMQTLDMVFRGSGECAEITWQFLGLSLPEVTLIMFSAYFGLCVLQFFRKSDDQLF